MATSKSKKQSSPRMKKPRSNIQEQVKDIYFSDLPNDLQRDLMEIHKMIVKQTNETWKDHNYDDIRNEDWAKTMIDEFLTMPMGKDMVGSVRLYKKKNRYSCMIQITGHVTNNREDIPHEFFHDFIRNVHVSLRPKIRRKYDMALTCESEHGEHFEGFDVWPKQKLAKELWFHFADTKIKEIKPETDPEIMESTDHAKMDKYAMGYNYIFLRLNQLPKGFRETVQDLNEKIVTKMKEYAKEEYTDLVDDSNFQNFVDALAGKKSSGGDIGYTTLYHYGRYNGITMITPEVSLKPLKNKKFQVKSIISKVLKDVSKELDHDVTKKLKFHRNQFIIILSHDYASKLADIDPIEEDVEFPHLLNFEQYRTMYEYEEANDCELTWLGEDVFTEKKTKLQYSVAKFKKKYDYDPKTKTILLDGKRVKVDIGNSLTVKVGDQYIPRQIGAIVGDADDVIILDDGYFKMGNQKQRDAILGHEIGHLKMHKMTTGKDNLLNPKFINRKVIESMISNQFVGNPILTQKDIKTIVDSVIDDPQIQQLLGKKVNDTEFEKIRNQVFKQMDKYIKGSKNSHLNYAEIEADRYGANSTSEKDMRKGLAKMYKFAKDPKAVKRTLMAASKATLQNFGDENPDKSDYSEIDPKQLAYIHKTMNILNDDEGKRRRKALKDPVIQGAKIYKQESDENTFYDAYEEAGMDLSDMTEKQAKDTMAALTTELISGFEKDPNKKMSQYSANIYANIITKNLLPIWASGYRKFSITLTDYQSFHTVELKVPTMTQDFVSRYVNGRETINGLLHRNAEIRVRMSPRVFHTMKNANDAYEFFKAMIKFYDSGLEKCASQLMLEIGRMNRELKYLVSNTKLSGLVILPFQMLTTFEDVDMSKRDTFKISKSEIKAVNSFIHNIYLKYASPEKEKKQILDDLQALIKSFNEACELDDNLKGIRKILEGFQEFDSGDFKDALLLNEAQWIHEQVDIAQTYHNENPETQYLQEKFGVKKLKKLPRDLVAYITIEAEAIEDANDKMMIASYCLGKLEIVEWYIELLDTNNPKYIVPHPRPYLVTLRTELLNCYKKIMATKIEKPSSRPIVDIKYPAGYEG